MTPTATTTRAASISSPAAVVDAEQRRPRDRGARRRTGRSRARTSRGTSPRSAGTSAAGSAPRAARRLRATRRRSRRGRRGADSDVSSQSERSRMSGRHPRAPGLHRLPEHPHAQVRQVRRDGEPERARRPTTATSSRSGIGTTRRRAPPACARTPSLSVVCGRPRAPHVAAEASRQERSPRPAARAHGHREPQLRGEVEHARLVARADVERAGDRRACRGRERGHGVADVEVVPRLRAVTEDRRRPGRCLRRAQKIATTPASPWGSWRGP